MTKTKAPRSRPPSPSANEDSATDAVDLPSAERVYETPMHGDPALAELLQRSPTAEERLDWAQMSPLQRARARVRAEKLDEWTKRPDPKKTVNAFEAGRPLKVGQDRLWQMASAWRSDRSLRNLGAFAGAPTSRARIGEADRKQLEEKAASIVAEAPRRSIRQMALELANAVQMKNIPGKNTLRSFIESAVRQQEMLPEVGRTLIYDQIGLSMRRPGGGIYGLGAIIDQSTGLLLGIAVGDGRNDRIGSVAAAFDAMPRLLMPAAKRLPWTRKVDLFQAPEGVEDWGDLAETLNAQGCWFETSGSPGLYLRRYLGRRLGRITLSPIASINTAGRSVPLDVYDVDAARSRVLIEAGSYNGRIARLISEAGAEAGSPDPVWEILRILAFG